MAPSHKLRALIVTWALALRDFIMTIPMRSSPPNRVQIGETSTKHGKGGNLPSQERLPLATAQARAV